MTPQLSEESLARFSERITSQLGLHFPRERWRDLERGLRAAARAVDGATSDATLERLLSGQLSQRDIELLASELTVGETYFFRDERTFDFLREQVLPELIARGAAGSRRLRIWSAGCCTGEEPYSLAILLDRFFPELRSWHVTILGTDVNPRFRERAAEGVFGEWSFRNAPPWLKENYFTCTGRQRYEVLPRIRERVIFEYLNLAEDTFPSLANGTNACDLILCRNVLMYFTAERVQAVIEGFHRALLKPGWLLVSAAETSAQLSALFTPVPFHGATFYRKSERGAAARTEPSPPTTWTPATIGREAATRETAPVEFAPASARAPGPDPAAAPEDFEAARALFARGDYAGTVQQLEAALALAPGSEQHCALLARACANLGDLGAARGWAERALAADKLDASLHYLRALIVQEQGDATEAAAAFRRTLYLDPEFALAHYGLGTLALRLGPRAEARRHFANALRSLARHAPDEVLPHADGLSAGRLKAMIETTLTEDRAA